MKRFFVYLSIITILFTSYSCKDNLFNFDVDHIDAEGEWGIPVLETSISVGQLLNGLKNPQNLCVGADGSVNFVFDYEFPDVITLKDLVCFEDKAFTLESSFAIPAHATNQSIAHNIIANVYSDKLEFKNALLKSGQLNMDFEFTNVSSNYEITLTCDNIAKADGQPITVTFSNSQKQNSLDLANCTITPNADGYIIFTSAITTNAAEDMNDATYSCHMTISHVTFQNILGKYAMKYNAIDRKITSALELDKLLIENLSINNPTLSFMGKNSLCLASGELNTLSYCEYNGAPTPLITSPIKLDFPVFANGYTPLTSITLPQLVYKSRYDSLHIAANLSLNPNGFSAGEFSLSEASGISLKVHCEMASNLSIDKAIYVDTTDNVIHNSFDFAKIEFIDELTLRIAFTHTLPFDLYANIDFFNSETSETTSLDLNDELIQGSFNGKEVTSKPIYVKLSKEKAKKIVNADKILQKYTIDTRGQSVTLTDTQFIKANIGAQIKYSEINL